jgi:DNA-binding MarR family transcriptional regulator
MTDSLKKFDLNDYIPCQLATLTQSIMRSVASLFEERYGISLSEWKVLSIIRSKPGLSAVAVARYAQMDTVAVSRAVTKLLDRNLVLRELDGEDRRRSVLDVLPEGLELHDQIAPLASELEASLLKELSEEELRVFEKAIRVLDAKAKVFTDAYRTPTRRAQSHILNGHGYAAANKFQPLRTGPLVFGRPLNTTTNRA